MEGGETKRGGVEQVTRDVTVTTYCNSQGWCWSEQLKPQWHRQTLRHFSFDRSATRTLFFVVFNGVVLFIADILFAAGGVCSHICLLFLSSFLRVLVWQIQFVISEKCQMKTMVDEIVIKNCEITKIVTHHCVLRLLTTWWERTLWQMLVLLLTRSLGRSERGRVPTRCLGRRGWLRLSLLTYKVFGKERLPLQADPGWFTYSLSCVTHVL